MIRVREITAQEWASCSEHAHRAVFSEIMPPEYDRIDFALLVYEEERELALGYITCRELSGDDVYLRHGGAFPPAEKKTYALRAYAAALSHLASRYKRMTTLVENTNRTYLRIALTAGFVPIGIRNFKGSVLVELLYEKE